MHDDFFRLNTDPQANSCRLPEPPEGWRWSENLWGVWLGEWLALYRPLNLSLIYLHRSLLQKAAAEFWAWDQGKLTDFFQTDNILIPFSSSVDQEERARLLQVTRQGHYRFICLLPTTKCPLHCAYCHQKPDPGKAQTMTVAELTAGLYKCAELCQAHAGPVDILLYGGDPLSVFPLTERLLYLIEPSRSPFHQPVRVTLTTTGFGLSSARAELLANHNVFVILSLDGPAESNDPVRRANNGQSAYQQAERAYRQLKAAGCRVGLSVTIGTHNSDGFADQLDKLLQHFQPHDVGLNAFLHRQDQDLNPFQLDSERALEAVIAGFRLTRGLGIFAEQPFRRLKPFAWRRPLVKDCSAGGERLVLVPGGYLGFCDSCFPDGRFFYTLDQFPDERHPDYQLWSRLSSLEMPTCRECPLKTLCGGACRYDAFKASGSLEGVDPLRCHFEKGFFHWILTEVLDQRPTDRADYFIPTQTDRESLFGNVRLTPENQPFTAGSFAATKP